MKLAFQYIPVQDMATALAFYRDTLGWPEAWREGDSTVALQIPDSDVQVMLTTDWLDQPGPMYLVPSVANFLAEHPDIPITSPHEEIPDGSLAALSDPFGNTFFVLDQASA